MNGVLATRALLRSYKKDNYGNQVSSVWESVKKRVGGEPPFRLDLGAEAKKSPLLAAEDTAGWKRLRGCCGGL
jgi:hypothetical protein